jgi:exosortase family protein XrtF
MNMLANIKEVYQNIPTAVRQFLTKALLLFIAWKLLFHLFLLPIRVPDKFLSDSNAFFTAKVFQQLYPNSAIWMKDWKDYKLYKEGIDHTTIVKDGKSIVGITDGCNGLEVFVLYVGFIVCIPTTLLRQLLFIVFGLLLLYTLNVGRVVALGQLHMHYKEFFDIAHHYIFKLIVYAVVFALWVWYAKKSDIVQHDEA